MLMLHAQRRAAVLIAPKNGLLLFQRGAIPELHMELDDTRRLIAAAGCPRRLALIGGHPYHFIHQRLIGTDRVRCAVFKAQQVNRRLFAFTPRGAIGNKPFTLPADAEQIRRMFNHIAQRMDNRILSIGTDLQQQIAMTERRIQRIVGEAGHFLQLFRRLIR